MFTVGAFVCFYPNILLVDKIRGRNGLNNLVKLVKKWYNSELDLNTFYTPAKLLFHARWH